VATALVAQDGFRLASMPPSCRADRGVVLAAVKRSGMALWLASEELRDDPEVVEQALRGAPQALQFVSWRLRGHKPTVLHAVAGATLARRLLFESLVSLVHHHHALNVKSQLLRSRPYALMHMLIRFTGMKYVHVFSGDPWALDFATDELRGDPEVVLAAVRRRGAALALAHGSVAKGDRAVVGAAVADNGLALQFASKALKADEATVLTAVTQNGLALRFASKALRTDRAVVAVAVSRNWAALRHAGAALRRDPDLALLALASDWSGAALGLLVGGEGGQGGTGGGGGGGGPRGGAVRSPGGAEVLGKAERVLRSALTAPGLLPDLSPGHPGDASGAPRYLNGPVEKCRGGAVDETGNGKSSGPSIFDGLLF